MKKSVLILGGSSSIARAIAENLAQQGYPLFLAGREEEELERLTQDLKLRYRIEVRRGFFDAEAYTEHEGFFQHVIQQCNGIEGIVVAFGEMGNPEESKHDFSEALKIINRNYIGACSILTYCADYLEMEKRGFIIGISSVAGDRGRQSNYIYGSAKGAFSLFLQGLRNRLYKSQVHVLTVKPGFVDTAMTFGVPGLFLVASPKYVGRKIVKALNRGRNAIYVPWFWFFIMGIIKSIPENIFKRLKL